MLFNLIIFLVSCIVLAKSSHLVIQKLLKIAEYLNLSEFVISFSIMAIATTLPDLFVGINSAINNNTALSLGNVLGSNIMKLTLICGIVILINKKITTKNEIIKKNTFYMLILSILPVIFMLNQIISRFEGIILILIFMIYIYNLNKKRLPITKLNKRNNQHPLKNFSLFLLGIILLIGSANLIVNYGNKLAIDLFVPPIFIGLFMIIIGTSMPELVFSIKASLAKHPKMSLGDLIGSNIINSTLVLGTTALIKPITADFKLFLIAALFLIAVSLIFTIFTKTNKKLSTKEGIILILIYITFIIIEFMLK